MRASYFKRIQAPPIIILSKRAFGFDLRETQWPLYTPRKYLDLKERALKTPSPSPSPSGRGRGEGGPSSSVT